VYGKRGAFSRRVTAQTKPAATPPDGVAVSSHRRPRRRLRVQIKNKTICQRFARDRHGDPPTVVFFRKLRSLRGEFRSHIPKRRARDDHDDDDGERRCRNRCVCRVGKVEGKKSTVQCDILPATVVRTTG